MNYALAICISAIAFWARHPFIQPFPGSDAR